MEISKKALIATFIIDLLLVAIGVICTVVLDFSVVALGIFLAVSVLILVSSVMVWHFAKSANKPE